jgi:hypothetical protein
MKFFVTKLPKNPKQKHKQIAHQNCVSYAPQIAIELVIMLIESPFW